MWAMTKYFISAVEAAILLKDRQRQMVFIQPMRVQIAGLPCTVIILIGWIETSHLCLSFNKVSWSCLAPSPYSLSLNLLP